MNTYNFGGNSTILAKLKIITVIVVCILSSYILLANIIFIYAPSYLKEKNIVMPSPKIKLGLDIKGGTQLILAIDINDYLTGRYNVLLNNIKESLWKDKIYYSKISVKKHGGIFIDNLKEPDLFKAAIQKILNETDHALSHSLNGNNAVIYYTREEFNNIKSKLLDNSIKVIRSRIDNAGTKEIIIQRSGIKNLLVQIPQTQDPVTIKRLLSKAAKLSFHLMDNNQPFSNTEYTYVEEDKMVLRNFESSQGSSQRSGYYKIYKAAALTGDMLLDARLNTDNFKVAIAFRLNGMGTRNFAEVTTNNVGKPFAIVMDGKVLTAPVINEPILGGNGIISGNFTIEEAKEIANMLRSGALPAKLSIVDERVIGPEVGREAIQSAKIALLMGLSMVMLFMVIYYQLLGLVADFAILLNLALAISAMSILGITLTLPGIAALLLTVGMSIDANVLIYERIKEEKHKSSLKKSNRKSFQEIILKGFDGSINTIIDSNMTTIISALTLVMIGSGFIRGFAISLIIGLISSLFTSVTFTKIIIQLLSRITKEKYILY